MSRTAGRIGLVLLAVCVLLGVVAAQFPASLAWSLLPAAARPHLRVEHAVGTLWSGRAQLASPWLAAVQEVQWRCAPDLRLRLACTLDGALTGTISIDQTLRLEGRGLHGVLPVQVVLQGTPRTTVDRLELSFDEVVADRAHVALAGRATLRGLVIAVAPGAVQAVPEVNVDCAAQGPASRCVVGSRGEPAPVAGTVEVSPGRLRGQLQLNLPGLPPQALAW